GGAAPAAPLQARLAATPEPARAGRPGTLTVTVENTGATPQRQVVLNVLLPPANLQPRADSIQPRPTLVQPSGIVQIPIAAELAPGAREAVIIPFQALAQGNAVIQAQVTSADAAPAEFSKTLLINPR
ncbi:MAG: hypothetical protein AAF790_10295, partial [Planctomycetota bacterium]